MSYQSQSPLSFDITVGVAHVRFRWEPSDNCYYMSSTIYNVTNEGLPRSNTTKRVNKEDIMKELQFFLNI